MKKFAYILSVVGAFIALQSGLYAQNKKYTLTGTVYDSITAKPINKAMVLISGTKYLDSSDSDGSFKIDNLVPGTNNLIVTAPGYDTGMMRFEIRKNMKLNVKLMPQPKDTLTNTGKKDTVAKADSAKKPPLTTEKIEKKQKEKKKRHALTDADKEQMRVLIEDVIFSKSIYFQKIKDKKKSVWLSGSFSIDTGYLYEFKAKFAKKPEGGYELLWLDFEMKGRNMNGAQ